MAQYAVQFPDDSQTVDLEKYSVPVKPAKHKIKKAEKENQKPLNKLKAKRNKIIEIDE